MNRRILLVTLCFVLFLGSLFSGCGKKADEAGDSKVKQKTTADKIKTKGTETEAATPKEQAVKDLDTAQKDISETISEVETEIEEIERIDTSQDNEDDI